MREVEVVAGIITGRSNRAIAESLYMSVETVRSHLKRVFKKVDAHTRSELVALAYRCGAEGEDVAAARLSGYANG